MFLSYWQRRKFCRQYFRQLPGFFPMEDEDSSCSCPIGKRESSVGNIFGNFRAFSLWEMRATHVLVLSAEVPCSFSRPWFFPRVCIPLIYVKSTFQLNVLAGRTNTPLTPVFN
jgi:hypothetical protein